MSVYFEATDPRGIHVRCTKEQWINHIVDGHSMMEGNEDAIRKTISSPEFIYESHDSDPPMDYREVYSRREESASYYTPTVPYTKVVVSTLGNGGEVISAYPAKNATGGTKGEPVYEWTENEDQL